MKYLEKFNFFYKKNKINDNVSFLDIYYCLVDVLDDRRIKTSFENEDIDIITVPDDFCANKKRSYFIIPKDSIYEITIFQDRIFINLLYNRNQITDEEIVEIFTDVDEKLNIYDCKLVFTYYSDAHNINTLFSPITYKKLNTNIKKLLKLLKEISSDEKDIALNIMIKAPGEITNKGLENKTIYVDKKTPRINL